MFSRDSRYAGLGTYTIRTARGTLIAYTRLPLPAASIVRGVHPRTEGQRLDHVAAHFLADATASWRLCDASDTLSPDALAARDEIPIPKRER